MQAGMTREMLTEQIKKFNEHERDGSDDLIADLAKSMTKFDPEQLPERVRSIYPKFLSLFMHTCTMSVFKGETKTLEDTRNQMKWFNTMALGFQTGLLVASIIYEDEIHG